MLTYELAHTVFDVDFDSGTLYWKISPAKHIKIGTKAGCEFKNKSGMRYFVVCYKTDKKRTYLVHRVIWLMKYGSWPDKDLHIDHIDGNGKNNNINNLRVVTCRENQLNRRIYREGRLPGVWHRGPGKWVASCGKKYLGTFETEELAHSAYLAELVHQI